MIDWTKPVRTVGLKDPVRILCTDAPGRQPIVGIVKDEVLQWTPGGSLFLEPEPSGLDVENVPEVIRYDISLEHPVKKWVVTRNGAPFALCPSRVEADIILKLMVYSGQ